MTEDVKLFQRVTIEQVEEGHELAPKFDENGLIACVTTAAATSGAMLLAGCCIAPPSRRRCWRSIVERGGRAPAASATAQLARSSKLTARSAQATNGNSLCGAS